MVGRHRLHNQPWCGLFAVISCTDSFVLQKLIKCKGSQAFVHRCSITPGQFPLGWVISNKAAFHDEDVPLLKRFCTDASVANSVTIFPLSTLGVQPTYVCRVVPRSPRVTRSAHVARRVVGRSAELTGLLMKYIEGRVGRLLKCFAADYLKDEFGQWWLLQVQAMAFVDGPLPRRVFCGSYRPDFEADGGSITSKSMAGGGGACALRCHVGSNVAIGTGPLRRCLVAGRQGRVESGKFARSDVLGKYPRPHGAAAGGGAGASGERRQPWIAAPPSSQPRHERL